MRKAIKVARYSYRFVLILIVVRFRQEIKIIVGAAETSQKGWYSTNEQWLDITKEKEWNRVFGGKEILSSVVAEHVFEHLSPGESRLALQQVYKHLRPNGRIRIAVPDGYHPNKDYLSHVGIDGSGADAADHKQLLTADILSTQLEAVGFISEMVEGYTRAGKLIEIIYSKSDGFILRSRLNEVIREKIEGWDFPDSHTSLIMDGIKQ